MKKRLNIYSIGAVFIIAVCVLWIFGSDVLGMGSDGGAHFTNEFDEFYIARDANFTQQTYFFSPGDTVYVRVVTRRFEGEVAQGTVSLKDYKEQTITSSVLKQSSYLSPYYFDGNVKIPENVSDYVQVIASLQWRGKIFNNKKDQFFAAQVLEIKELNQYMRYYSSQQFNEETYAFNTDNMLFIKMYGEDMPFVHGFFIVKDMKEEERRYILTTRDIKREGKWYYATVDSLRKQSFLEEWYMGEITLYGTADRVVSHMAKFFLVDNTTPVTQISSPVENSVLSGVVDIIGTAKDNNIKRYDLYVQDLRNSEAPWETIFSGFNSVDNEVLFRWDTAEYRGAALNIKLAVVDYAGNSTEYIVPNVFVNGTLEYNVPPAGTMPSITTSTLDNTITGYIGEGNGEGDFWINDRRGNKPGWTVTIQFSNFKGNASVIPVSKLTIIPGEIHTANSLLTGITQGPAHQFSTINDIVLLMSASPGYGYGKYWQQEMLKLTVAADIPADSYKATAAFTIQ